MTVTGKLLTLFRVEQQIRGLRTRLDAATRYLAEQERQLKTLDERHASLKAQSRQLEATVHNDETEGGTIDARIAKLREQMNSARTDREYKAFLTEINTLKADKSKIDERGIGALTRLDELRAQLAEIETQRAERAKVRDHAKAERDQRESEIRDRLKELEAERAEAIKEVPASALGSFNELAARADEPEEIMAPLEEHDRKRHEYICGSCQTILPMEKVNGLMGRGELTTCTSCGVILYLEESVREAVAIKR